MNKRKKFGPWSFYRLDMTTFGATFREWTIRFECGPFRSTTSWVRDITFRRPRHEVSISEFYRHHLSGHG